MDLGWVCVCSRCGVVRFELEMKSHKCIKGEPTFGGHYQHLVLMTKWIQEKIDDNSKNNSLSGKNRRKEIKY